MIKKTYMINHISIKQMWLKENIILIKKCTKMGGSKNVKDPIKKMLFIVYQRTKVQKMGNPRNEGVEKPK